MAEEDDVGNCIHEPGEFRRSKLLSVTIGPDEDDDTGDEELSDQRFAQLREAMHQACLDENNAPFVTDDVALALPSTSNTGSAHILESVDLSNALNDVFSSGQRLFQPLQDENFIEEIFVEKPPKFVGDYLFGDAIGEGSYGKVKEALHRHTLLRVAVKIIKDKRIRKIPGGEENVQNEIKILQKIHHPNVIQLIECFRIDEKQKLYMVFDFCVISLQQLLDSSTGKKFPIRADQYDFDAKRLPEFQAHLYFKQLLAGLEHLHSKGIVHKDIKPGNLLLALDGCLKICDMGVAEELDLETNEDWCTMAQGTPKFQPPEVVNGANERFRGFPMDIWASGVTLYNLVSGTYPFEGDVIMKLFDNIVHLPLKMPEEMEFSEDLVELLHGLLDKDPNQRWNMQRIQNCLWIIKEHKIEPSKIIPIPNGHESSLDRVLEQLYEDGMSPVLGTSTEILNQGGHEQVEIRTSLIPDRVPATDIDSLPHQPVAIVPTSKSTKKAKKKDKRSKKLKNGSSVVASESWTGQDQSSMLTNNNNINNSQGSETRRKNRLFSRCFRGNDSP